MLQNRVSWWFEPVKIPYQFEKLGPFLKTGQISFTRLEYYNKLLQWCQRGHSLFVSHVSNLTAKCWGLINGRPRG